ncbi:MAG TPA: site-2 protease family protein [Phototrophicaceae bacterium]|nr:site-2 protease family protein [Phototrophicaceae bacterium]
MLNETASSIEDRPALRSAVRYTPEDAQHSELREQVMGVLSIERETFEDENKLPRESLLLIGQDARLVATFEGRLLLDSEAAYDQLDRLLEPGGYVPLFREINGKHVVFVVAGRSKPKPRPWWPNALLFVITIFSVLLVGTDLAIDEIANGSQAVAQPYIDHLILNLWRGLPYTIAILLILGSHELGHYFAARHHKLAVTLPYFIPAPFISLIGTFGAFIQLREPMRNRKVLLDVGAAGPLTGLIFAIPILLIGLKTSLVGPIQPGSMVEGNSLLYAFAKIIVFGHFLPNGAQDVYVNQLAWAGWTGLLVTSLNLIPIGQLDGGHILYSLIGDRARILFYPLLVVMLLLVLTGSAEWLFWLILLFLFGRIYAAPLDMITPMDNRRKAIAVFGLIVFVLIFIPIPFSYTPEVAPSLPGNAIWLPTTMLTFYTLWRRR